MTVYYVSDLKKLSEHAKLLIHLDQTMDYVESMTVAGCDEFFRLMVELNSNMCHCEAIVRHYAAKVCREEE